MCKDRTSNLIENQPLEQINNLSKYKLIHLNENEQVSKQFKYFQLRALASNSNIRYFFVDEKAHGLVWTNIFVFFVLHIYYFYGLYTIISSLPYKIWIFGYFYSHLAGLGVTMGAHRLWAHRSYSARLPLRILLCALFTIAGQNDLITWVRDHRVHHKYTETDADPHNSKRGMFFAHVGWLLTKKHPDVFIKGKTIELHDLEQDPVIRFQRRFYVPLYLFFRFVIPIFIPIMLWNESLSIAVLGLFTQYIGTLHSTWFVNSAAHLFGDRPYNKNIRPGNNFFVNIVAMGEGFHNYHHVFPFDYAIDEHGSKINLGKHFIDLFAKIGWAYQLKRANPQTIAKTKLRIQNEICAQEQDYYLNPHPY